jgi:hypothetical protein
MSQEFWFGVELEFALAASELPEHELPVAAKGKKLCFLNEDERALHGFRKPGVRMENIFQDILEVLTDAGLSAPAVIEGDSDEWSVGSDGSVKGSGGGTTLEWFGIEVRSPAMSFCAENFQQIHLVCNLLQQRYLTETNESSGLHVHLSRGADDELDFPTLRNLLCFLWAFEPQIDTLHPRHRQHNSYCKSLRQAAAMSGEYYQKQGIVPRAMQGVLDLRQATTMRGLLEMIASPDNGRGLACNVRPMKNYLFPYYNEDHEMVLGLPTIEFRQHEGTLDPQRIWHWVSVLHGIAEYCQSADPFDFDQLLRIAELERWVKTGNGADDAENEETHGPVPAEGNFTIVDLLRSIALGHSAEYYAARLFPLAPRPPRMHLKGVIHWEYEQQREALSASEFDRLHCQRKLWESLQHVVAARKYEPSAAPRIDFEHDMWPVFEWAEDEGGGDDSELLSEG